jgi:hypothetical protein
VQYSQPLPTWQPRQLPASKIPKLLPLLHPPFHCSNTSTAAPTGLTTTTRKMPQMLCHRARRRPTKMAPRRLCHGDLTTMARRSRQPAGYALLHTKKSSTPESQSESSGASSDYHPRMQRDQHQTQPRTGTTPKKLNKNANLHAVSARTSYSDQAQTGEKMRRKRRLRLEV